MKTYFALAFGGLLMGGAAFAIGPRGGGGGGRMGGGGAVARPAAAPHPTPSFSHPAPRPNPAPRPAAPVTRPNPAPVARPATRPGMVPGNRPNPPSPTVIHPNSPGNWAGGGARPNSPSPPVLHPNNPGRPTTLPAKAPGFAGGGTQFPNRPPVEPKRFPGGAGGGVPQPPALRPPVINNPKTGIANVNRPNANNPYIHTGNINRNNINNVNVNRIGNNFANVNNRPWPGYGPRPLPYPTPYRPNWGHWNQGYWNSWYNRPGLGFGTGLAFGWLLSPGQSMAYSNPYYGASPSGQMAYDYSQPIAATAPGYAGYPTDVPFPTDVPVQAFAPPPTDPAATPSVAVADEKNAEAMRNFDAARAAFKVNDYAKALELDNAAIKLQPADGSLHEFRGLVLFAAKDYQQAAGTDYSVLAAGPGWNWETVKTLYDSPTTYAQQLRDLEAFQKANPTQGYASFLLAYHYLMLDSVPQAIAQLENAVARTPGDDLSKLLLKSLKEQQERPLPASP